MFETLLSYKYNNNICFWELSNSKHALFSSWRESMLKLFSSFQKKWNHFQKISSCQDLRRSEFVILIVTKRILCVSFGASKNKLALFLYQIIPINIVLVIKCLIFLEQFSSPRNAIIVACNKMVEELQLLSY